MQNFRKIFNNLVKKINNLKISKKDKEDLINNLIDLTMLFQDKILDKQIDFEKRILDIEQYLKEDSDFCDNEYIINCPYCNKEVYVIMKEEKIEIKCPICKKVIQVEYDNDSQKGNN